MLLCLVVGVACLGYSSYAYFTDNSSNYIKRKQDMPVPLKVFQAQVGINHAFAYVVMPCLAASFLVVGFSIWDYRRKSKQANLNDYTLET